MRAIGKESYVYMNIHTDGLVLVHGLIRPLDQVIEYTCINFETEFYATGYFEAVSFFTNFVCVGVL